MKAYHRPVCSASTDAEDKAGDDCFSFWAVGDLGMELKAINGLRVMSDGGKRSSLSVTDDMEILGKILELIPMRHPDLESRTHADGEEVMSCYEGGAHLHFITQVLKECIDRALAEPVNLYSCMAILAMITFCYLAFEIPRDFLSNITDTIREASRSDMVASEHEPAVHSKCQGLGHQVRISQDLRVARPNRTPSMVIRKE